MIRALLIWLLPSAMTSWILTGVVLRIARRLRWLDHPIERSSHVAATPTSGGIGLVSLVSGVFLWGLDGLPGGAIPLVLGGLLIAAIGLLDDLRPLPVLPRLIVQAVGVSAALSAIGPIASLDLGFATLEPGAFGWIAAALAGIWFVNLFNFMDGIDGIASAEAAFVGLVAGILVWPQAPELAIAWWVLSGASAGLLVWSWPPAKIFMGDVGSGFIGFVIAALLIRSLQVAALNLPTALVLVAPFLCDTTLTLLRRMARGEAWYAGHRLHAYQHLSRRWGRHLPVTLASIGLNFVLVAPAAWLCAAQPSVAPWVALAIFAIISVLALRAGSGRSEANGTSQE